MTRKKVDLALIANDAARKASLKKRRAGLIKKVSELTTLCGVNAFAVVYSLDDNEPMIWPSLLEVQQLLSRFETTPEMERSKKMVNQESYLKERICKVQDQSNKYMKKSMEMEMAYLMHQLHYGKGMNGLELTELHGLVFLIDEKIKEIRRRVEYLQQPFPFPPNSFIPLPSPQGLVVSEAMSSGEVMGRTATVGNGRQDGKNYLNPTWDQWFINMMNNNVENVTAGRSEIESELLGGPQLQDRNSNNNRTPMSSYQENTIAGNHDVEHVFSSGLSHAIIGGTHGGWDPNYNLEGLPYGNVDGSHDVMGIRLHTSGGSNELGKGRGLRLPHHGNILGINSGNISTNLPSEMFMVHHDNARGDGNLSGNPFGLELARNNNNTGGNNNAGGNETRYSGSFGGWNK